MHASKPDLLYVLLWVVGLTEQVLTKKSTLLVYRDGVPDNVKICIAAGRERKVNSVVDPTHRADRIPHPNKVGFALAREGSLKIGRHIEIDVSAFDHSNRIRNKCIITFAQQSYHIEHPA